ncbi:hypothetical protein Hypma_010039 [Hypsizygus marmoreus]|uniref:Uncharacterized protein n=1 Tax=Hypsizygus marmoreus TaxID=39966 RepID=A0A369JMF3_HYPMA|nr:hypothetical protein Hypma_010039 [Hypsizygus marmoreus]
MGNQLQDEVVDDSEPEREALRRRERVGQKGGLREHENIRVARVATEVIEITDDEESDYVSHVATRVIDISDVESGRDMERDGINDTHLHVNVENATGVPPHISSNSPSTKSLSKSARMTFSSSQASLNGHSDDEGLNGGINLARFAYSGTSNAVYAKPTLSRQGSNISSENEPRVAAKKRLGHRFSSDFSDAELAKLTKCVSCDIRWTARKTAPQKMMHVQSCAKKNSFNDETIRILIRKELDNTTVTSTNGKGKAKATAGSTEPTGSQTYLEAIVADAAPKKKGRRLEASETVKNITLTRDAILDKARTVLGPTRPADTFVVHTQSVGAAVGDAENTGYPSTQGFGSSSLGLKYVQQSKSLFAHSVEPSLGEDESEAVAPSPTQSFALSKRGSVIRQPSRSLFEDFPTPTSSSGPSIMLSAPFNDDLPRFPSLNPAIHLPHTSARDLSQRPAPRTADSPRRRFVTPPSSNLYVTWLMSQDPEGEIGGFGDHNTHIDEFGQDNDDAYLHFGPGFDNLSMAGGCAPGPVVPAPDSPFAIKKNVAMKAPSVRKPSQPKASFQSDETVPTKRNINVKRSEKQRARLDDDFDEAWEMKLRDKIFQDSNLYLRILRYEPIHFDVFLQLASEEPTYSGKLKARLRSFLDKQAVHFYGAEPTGRAR